MDPTSLVVLGVGVGAILLLRSQDNGGEGGAMGDGDTTVVVNADVGDDVSPSSSSALTPTEVLEADSLEGLGFTLFSPPETMSSVPSRTVSSVPSRTVFTPPTVTLTPPMTDTDVPRRPRHGVYSALPARPRAFTSDLYEFGLDAFDAGEDFTAYEGITATDVPALVQSARVVDSYADRIDEAPEGFRDILGYW